MKFFETITTPLSEIYSLLMVWPLLTAFALVVVALVSYAWAVVPGFGLGDERPSQPRPVALIVSGVCACGAFLIFTKFL